MAGFHAYRMSITVEMTVSADAAGNPRTLPVDTLPAMIAATLKQALVSSAPAIQKPVVVLGAATAVTLP